MIRAFWYSKPHLNRGNVINFGDELSRLLLEQISKDKVKWIHPLKQTYLQQKLTKHILGIGSILHFSANNSKVWGSGLIEKSSEAANANYYAVRGKFTQDELKSRGFKVPSVYGDPGLLTPKYFQYNLSKKYKVGIIPHYVEFDEINKWFKENNLTNEFLMIDLRKPVDEVLTQINECESIISSSLHGIIVPQAYAIPTLRVSFTDKIIGDGIKYADYFHSVGINEYDTINLLKKDFKETEILGLIRRFSNSLLIKNDLMKIQEKLLKAKPF